MDKDTPDEVSLGTDEEDTEPSINKDNYQLEGPLRKIPRTDNPFPEDVQFLTFKNRGSQVRENTLRR